MTPDDYLREVHREINELISRLRPILMQEITRRRPPVGLLTYDKNDTKAANTIETMNEIVSA